MMPGTPAEKAGLKRGDVIVAFNGKAVSSSRGLPPMVANTSVGQEVTLAVVRDGKKQVLPITVGKLPVAEARAEAPSQTRQGQWGRQL
jgi:serine protease Do